MAKKDIEALPKNTREELEKLIEKKWGAVQFDGSYIRDNKKVLIPTTPSLDIELGGGIPEGSWTLITGQKKVGKSCLSLQIAANAQALGYYVYYFNVEHRFGEKNLSSIRHLKTDSEHFKIIQSSEDRILSAEDHLEIAVDIMSSQKRCVVIMDSISSLCSANEMSKDIGEASRPEGPKMLGKFCRRLESIVPINNIVFIGMLHLYANTSGYGAAWIEDGGNKIQYQCDTKLRCKSISPWEKGTGEDKKRIGQTVDWEVSVNANGPPGGIAKSYLRYGYGYDDTWEIICLACDFGLIQKGGAWYTFEDIKVQGQEKLYDYFQENPDKLTALYSSIKEMSA